MIDKTVLPTLLKTTHIPLFTEFELRNKKV